MKLEVMSIRQKLPAEFAEKWRRLLAFQGGDPEALALAAVELLWKKYGKEVVKNEHEMKKYDMPVGIFLGRHDLTMNANGNFRLPDELMFMVGGAYCWMKNGRRFCIAPAAERDGEPVRFDKRGRFALPKSFGASHCVRLVGKMRYLLVEKVA